MFNVGEKVRVRSFESIPKDRMVGTAGDNPRLWSRRKAVACGKTATIVDAYESERYKARVYKLHIDGQTADSLCLFLGEDLERATKEIPNWDVKFESAENLVIARLYIDGKLVSQGHGHVFHDDTAGYVQAASYAMKKIWQKYTGEESNE